MKRKTASQGYYQAGVSLVELMVAEMGIAMAELLAA
jgi:Tfp pilus assembly protein PilW